MALSRWLRKLMARYDPNRPPHSRYLTGPRLAAMRRIAKWSQQELACRTGVHVQTVKYWERQPGKIAGHAPDLFRKQFAAKRITTETAARLEPGYVDPKTCKARTRAGTPCKMKAVHGKKRCRLHGGLSTGPKTAEGRERIRQAQFARWRASRSPTSRSLPLRTSESL